MVTPSSNFAAAVGARKMKSKDKMATVMGEFKRGKLHSGSKKGPKVKSRKQAIAIGMNEAGKGKGDMAMLKKQRVG